MKTLLLTFVLFVGLSLTCQAAPNFQFQLVLPPDPNVPPSYNFSGPRYRFEYNPYYRPYYHGWPPYYYQNPRPYGYNYYGRDWYRPRPNNPYRPCP